MSYTHVFQMVGNMSMLKLSFKFIHFRKLGLRLCEATVYHKSNRGISFFGCDRKYMNFWLIYFKPNMKKDSVSLQNFF